MQKNEIQKYEPMICVRLKDGRALFTLASFREEIEKRWSAWLPVRIEGETIASTLIESIKGATPASELLSGLPKDIRIRVQARCREFKVNLGRSPSYKEKIRIIEKISKQFSGSKVE